ncbi:MAG TPA: winged helix DNA-binding domain-containing protein [Baekduia sp.]|uniref:winged helix DNA-binding domain-containing protein n=1 Tax=Baekduia sp. TaxID=2600305 RepID=UPI002D76558D|nr:winged helix DNA-binding domain-containing protein [Baekduia sp.]HET6509342.1 winged helix DNA-binding domain-containing protein [Baekduia sp.]
MPAVLDRRALNRALLARQWLLGPRRAATALEAIEHLGGLQAQDAKAPYFQLWARLANFDAAELSDLLERREAVRIAAQRSTIHLLSGRDAPALRALGQREIVRATDGNWKLPTDVDGDAVMAAGRALVDAQPRTFAQLAAELGPRWPHADPKALAQQVRARVPLVQVPPRGLWGRGGAPAHTSLEAWTGRTPPAPDDLDLAPLIRRYLAAFGPARAADFQKWSGRRAGVIEAFAALRSDLMVFADEDGRELLDLPDAPRPAADTPAPPRLTGPFDNLILSHADTARVLPAEHRPRVMTQNGLIAGLVLVDGFVAGTWKLGKATKKSATLTIAGFEAFDPEAVAALTDEATRLLDFAAPGSAERDVVLAPAG